MPRPDLPSTQAARTGTWWMLGVVLGCALQMQQAQLWHWAGYALCALIGGCGSLALLVRCSMESYRIPAMLLLGAAMAWGSTGWRASHFQAQRLSPVLEGRDVRITGVIDAMPQRTERGLRLQFQPERAYVVSPQDVDPAQPVPLSGKLDLRWYGEPPPQGLQAGQRWEWTVRLKAPHGSRNPHGMDWELWLWIQGIQATGYVRNSAKDAPARWLGQTWQAPMAQWRNHLHSAMQPPQQYSTELQQAYGVVQALVTGAQSSIQPRHWQLFRDTGVAHLVSISGLHITMFAWLAMAMVQALWRQSPRCCLWCPSPKAGAWAGLGLAVLYAVFSGWGIPAQRTIGMLAVVVWLRGRGGVWPWPYVWLMVLCAVLLIDPWAWLQPGFWLSFVAVGVLFAAQHKRPQINGVTGGMRGLLHEQLTVGLALAPLTLVLFGQVSLVGLLANLWAIPWVTLVVTPMAMLGVVWPPLWWAAAWCVSAMLWLLELMAAWPLAVLYFAQPPWWAAAAGVLACLWLVLPWPRSWRVLVLPALLPMLWWQPVRPAPGALDVWALDVGQGSAVLLRTAQHSLLFDAGPRWTEHADAGERVVLPLLRALSAAPDVLMLSHEDTDHAGGMGAIAAAYPEALRMGAAGQPCQAGLSWLWTGVRFEVLHPLQPPDPQGTRRGNAHSCVLRVVAQSGAAVLLTGDIEVAQEQALLQAGAPLRSDVVIVPHHGSQTSSSAAWVAAVTARFAIVQSGYRNRFGHPHRQVTQRYEDVGTRWVASPACGAAYWSSAQPDQLQCERAVRPRYWQYRAP